MQRILRIKELSKFSRLQADRDDHVKVRAVTVMEVFKSAGTLVIEVQVQSQQPGILKSWMRISQ